MKRIISLIMAVILVLSAATLAGCGSAQNSTDAPTQAAESGTGANDNNTDAVDQNNSSLPTGTGTVPDGLEVDTVSYTDNDGKYVYLLITNKTGKVININASIQSFDAAGEGIGTEYPYSDAVDADTTVCVSSSYPFKKEMNTFAYTIEYVEADSTEYVPADKNVAVDVEKFNDKADITITNNGDFPITHSAWYDAFFYKGDELVYAKKGDFVPGVGLNPGESLTARAPFNGDQVKGFDDVKVYCHCYNYNENNN